MTRWVLGLICLATLTGFATADEPVADPLVLPKAAVQELSTALRDGLQPRNGNPSGELTPDAAWREAKSNSVAAILIPGLFADGDSMVRIQRALQQVGIPTARFQYADQLPIEQVSETLRQELLKLKRERPRRRVCLVTHSLGGLVARSALESPDRASLGVTKLVMVAPPNHGSALATLSASEISDYIEALGGAKIDLGVINEAINQFVGEAKESLQPGSEFLTKLNNQPRAAGVNYTILAGTGGPIHREMIELPVLLTDLLLGTDAQREKTMAPLKRISGTAEWIHGEGDGVVAVSSARLAGVSDFATFRFRHRDFGSAPLTEVREQAVAQVTQAICKRLMADSNP